mgnify:CR=1 FL=1
MLLSYLEANRIEAGCDEAGRGCLAGSVYTAAVILPPDFHNEDLNDSKQLSEKKRYALRPIIEREAIAWAVGIVTGFCFPPCGCREVFLTPEPLIFLPNLLQ